MTLKTSHIALCVFCTAVCALSFFTLAHYPGHAVIYIVFTVALNALFVVGFTGNKIFFDTFIGIFFWLGFWLKFSIRVAFMGGKFHEPVGNFSGTGADFDRALLVTSCGIAALLAASFVRRGFFFSYGAAAGQRRLEAIFAFYRNHRKLVLALFVFAVVFIAVTNTIFGIYQRGTVPRTILPLGLSGVYSWLLLFGLASFSAVILDCEFRIKRNPYLVSVISLLECFFSNASMLSRGMILNAGSLMIGIIDNAKRRLINLGPGYILIVLAVFGTLFVSSVSAVNYIRSYTIISSVDDAEVRHSRQLRSEALKSGTYRSGELDSPELNVRPTDPSDLKSIALKSSVHTSRSLFLDRWVGMEGVMAVSSYPHLGWGLWKRAWRERYSHSGTSMYDMTFIRSPYLQVDMSIYHFVGLPGILAFFYYPGSYPFLFFAMFIAGLLGAGVEWVVYRLGGANIVLCSLIAQVVAYRYAHFGYVPYQSYLLFGAVFLNVIFIFGANKLLVLHGKGQGA